MNADAVIGNTVELLGHNLFAYCGNNPVNKEDSSGCIVETIVDIASVGLSLYDLAKNPSWVNFGFLAWDAASVILPGIPGSYIYKGAKVLNGVSKLKSFIKRNFSHNLTQLIGKAPSWMVNPQAHHVLPQKFGDFFASKGLEIHDPRFGTWVEGNPHSHWSREYNTYWEDYIEHYGDDATPEQVIDYARTLAETFNFDINF